MSFLPVDVVVWVGGGLLTAILIRKEHRLALTVAVSLAVVTLYLTGYLVVLSFSTGRGWPAVGAMAASSVLSGALARATDSMETRR
jgi:CHASE2 domain-containing sensor protein